MSYHPRFRYVNMDASWDSYNRSSTGSLVPDPKLWPSGMASRHAAENSFLRAPAYFME
jgi:hypothetical protein